MITHYQNIQLSSIYTTSLTLPQVGHASWPCLTCFVDTEIVVFQEPYWKYLQVASWKECRRDLNHPRTLFTNKVTINFDMLCAFMKNKILSYMERWLTVTKQMHSLFMEYAEGGKKRFQLYKLTSYCSIRVILSFSRRSWNSCVFLSFPRNRWVCKSN